MESVRFRTFFKGSVISIEFLVQYKVDGIQGFTNKIVNSCWIINATNEIDINGIVELHVYDITEFGEIKPLHYTGWQPGCLVEYADDENKVVIRGYGTDH